MISINPLGCMLMEGLNDSALEQVAGFFRAMAEPLRLKILNVLRSGERNVGEITAELACSQANASKHLGILMEVGMVDRRKEGLNAFYFISDPQIIDLCELMCAKMEKEFAQKSAHFR